MISSGLTWAGWNSLDHGTRFGYPRVTAGHLTIGVRLVPRPHWGLDSSVDGALFRALCTLFANQQNYSHDIFSFSGYARPVLQQSRGARGVWQNGDPTSGDIY